MPNLIGTGLNQAPTNSMLGGLAYQSPDYASIKNLDLRNIAEINAETADTATDVFVYDTSKDSDGGAWRQRTQHTSWYNETLNTATRGSRREFPAVAVIVAEATQLTIYDGEDPDLPMWMVFTFGMIRSGVQNTNVLSAVSMLNGVLFTAVGSDSNNNPYSSRIDFLKEECKIWGGARYYVLGGIVARNGGHTFQVTTNYDDIVNPYVNDVAMTVLPSAPIDDATGLPVPTIAVATNGGVSVIKDDGSVSDLKRGSTSYTNSVQFTDNNSIMLVWGHASDAIRHINHYSYTDWQSDKNDYDQTSGYYELPQFKASSLQSPLRSSASGITSGILANLDGENRVSARWDNYGLKIAELNDLKPTEGMVCHIRTDSNTGWMVGDTKGAFLSNTTAGSISSTNLVTGDFSANWTGATNGVLSVSNGQLTITNSGGSNGRAVSNYFATTAGKRYAFIVTAVSNSSGSYRSEVRGPELVTTVDNDGEKLVTYFNGNGNSMYVELYAIGSNGASATYEDAYVVELEEDQSANNKGLQIFGTVTKSSVTTGSEVMAYSGFNATNYLHSPAQPNHPFSFARGDFNLTFWAKVTSTNPDRLWFCIGDYSTSSINGGVNSIRVIQLNSGGDGDTTYFYSGLDYVATTSEDSLWHQWCFFRKDGVVYLYKDAVLQGSTPSLTSIIGPDTWGATIGTAPQNGVPFAYGADYLSLFRISATPPFSEEQIKKIYNDEKSLFLENTSCTLYGSSNAVTALAYDDSTSLLHVGTSSGRSDFTGLKRINHTTSAVSTAISAQDGLIAQQ